MESQSPAHAAKHAGINLGLYAIVCLILAVAYVAYDTNLFTKPPSWWQVRQAIGYASPPLN